MGSLKTPYVIRFRNTTGMDEKSSNFAFFNGSEWVITNEELCHGATLQIIDIMGRVVISVSGHTRSVPTAGMLPCVYVLRLIGGNDVITQKIVIN